MMALAGMGCLAIAFLASLAQGWWGLRDHAYTIWAMRGQLVALFGAMGCLIAAFVLSDFSLILVAEHSNLAQPLLYRIAAAWGQHEGSMLLWITLLGVYGGGATMVRIAPPALQASLGVHGLLQAGLIAFLAITSNPFAGIQPVPEDGATLNPLLQDVALAIHPPMLYLGYVGFGLVFCLACGAMLRREVTQYWARLLHPWICLSWGFLTLGIGLGSWWAYHELGWGGWWFWDPVENISLMPWLAGTALLHSNLAFTKRNALPHWVVLLSILCFLLCLIGTFMVRSGLVTSVHAFASDPSRGLVILAYIAAVGSAALLLFARMSKQLATTPPLSLRSREGLILVNNLLLLAGCATIFLAVLYPAFYQALGLGSLTVGAPYYHRSFLPVMAGLLALSVIGLRAPWQPAPWRQLLRTAEMPAMAALAGIMACMMLIQRHWLLTCIGMALGIWVLAGAFFYMRHLQRQANGWRLLRNHAGAVLAHAGLSILAFGITLTSLHVETFESPLRKRTILSDGWQVQLVTQDVIDRGDHIAQRLRLEVLHNDHKPVSLAPEIRFYKARRMETSEAAIHSNWARDIHATIQPGEKEDTLSLRLLITPGMWLVWLAFALCGCGGLLSAITSFTKLKKIAENTKQGHI